ncbi:MAG: bifunctional phosphoribosylaminoimidazolecarboxamide formyltransferase/IMP cyclohydrolase [Pseudomonadota bacterium]
MKVERALISVSDKSGIVEFAKGLAELGIEILSTGGTAKALQEAKIPVIEISDYTGSPEILDGRLKTLHPKIHGGLLAMRGNTQHQKQMAENNIHNIDLAVVNLYPFEATVAKPDCSFEQAIENIDIGGPTMLRAAAKNYQDVAVVCDPRDYAKILSELKTNQGKLSKQTKFSLAKKVFAQTAKYDAAIISYLSKYDADLKQQEHPDVIGFTFEKVQDLRYGENPHQKAAFYKSTTPVNEPALTNATQLHGKELSYNNIMDADAAIEMVAEFRDQPFAAVVVKHSNPCGAATSDKSLQEAFTKALACDPTSAFGGIVSFNKEVDSKTAQALSEIFFEVIAAPKFSAAAKEILMKKKNIRLLEIPQLTTNYTATGIGIRKVVGGVLIQDRDLSLEKVRQAKVVTKRAPTEEEWQALDFAWRICKHVKSNAIVYAAKDRTIGIGAGQMSRVDSSKIAVMKAQSSLKGSVIASDAFFPFRDGIDEAAKAGATAVIQPGGSIKDDEAILAANEHNMAMVFTGVRHFRH